MDVNEFIKKIESEIEELAPGTLKPETEFKTVGAWSSMHALILIALVDAEYNVTITGADLRNSRTVNDLFEIIKSRT